MPIVSKTASTSYKPQKLDKTDTTLATPPAPPPAIPTQKDDSITQVILNCCKAA